MFYLLYTFEKSDQEQVLFKETSPTRKSFNILYVLVCLNNISVITFILFPCAKVSVQIDQHLAA